MRLLIDAQLPPSLARAFSDAGFPARHVRSVGHEHSGDDEIWAFAAREGDAIMTKDADFAERWERGDRAVPIVWVRIRNCSTAVLIGRLSPRFAKIVALLDAGETLIELG